MYGYKNNSYENITFDPCETDFGGMQVFLLLMYSLVILIAVGGNVLVCYIVLAHKRMRTATNFFLLNLAVSDITKAIICIPFTFVANMIVPYWPFGSFMCPFVTYMQAVAVFLSAFTLVGMSMDRYVAILYPLRPKLTIRKVIYVLALVWILALAVPLPTAILSVIISPFNTSEDCQKGLCMELFEYDNHKYIYSMMIMCLQYFVPLIVLMFTYARIGYVIWLKKIPGEAVKKRDDKIASSKRKMVKMMIVVVLIYAICWLPLHAITLAGDRHPSIYNIHNFQIIWIACHWLAMSHACYNPIVYFWMNKRFRACFQNLFCMCSSCQEKLNKHFYSLTNIDTNMRYLTERIQK
ncbi:hypothetical protein ACJMK2_035643 [Sinanodonta woodiana]|uniref:G-protein coupled receptors family 1 profile domain-containing protein n=1 Tax=Sinanodonta woodiana TaxID=1069815 RepID=A0ABD3WZ20_SINWO